MNGEHISRCLDALPDPMLEEAMKPYKPRSLGRHIFRIAACLALVIGVTALLWPKDEEPGEQMGVPIVGTTAVPTLPTQVPTVPEMPTLPTETQGYELVKLANVVKLYSYSKANVSEEELAQYEVTDAVAAKQTCWIEWTDSEFYGIKLFFSLSQDYYGDAEITFRLETAYGEYWGKQPETNKFASLGKTVETGNPGYVSWKPGDDLEKMRETLNPSALYLQVLIYADDQPVGFGLLELNCQQLTKHDCYAVALLRFRTICYPLVDGQFQNVTEDDVRKEIAVYEAVMLEEYEAWRSQKTEEQEGV